MLTEAGRDAAPWVSERRFGHPFDGAARIGRPTLIVLAICALALIVALALGLDMAQAQQSMAFVD